MTRRAGSVLVRAAPPGALDARRVRELGGRPRGSDRAGSTGAWIASITGHLLLGSLAFFVTWTVIARAIEEEPPVVTLMDFHAPRFDPLEPPPDASPPPDAPAVVDAATEQAPGTDPAVALMGRPVEIVPEDGNAAPLAPLAVEGSAASRGASFAGLRASNAKRIVYVVDASGSLIGTFPALAEELARSLERLDRRQSFAIIFFQRNQALPTPPGRLMPATEENIRRATAWFTRQIFPTGRSNPLPALEAAMALEPDLIFLLSAGVTGAGEYEMTPEQLVDAVDRLNPVRSRSGRRRVRIQCIGFLDRDATAVLERIADMHGGAESFRFLSRDELGLAPGQRGPDGAPILE